MLTFHGANMINRRFDGIKTLSRRYKEIILELMTRIDYDVLPFVPAAVTGQIHHSSLSALIFDLGYNEEHILAFVFTQEWMTLRIIHVACNLVDSRIRRLCDT